MRISCLFYSIKLENLFDFKIRVEQVNLFELKSKSIVRLSLFLYKF